MRVSSVAVPLVIGIALGFLLPRTAAANGSPGDPVDTAEKPLPITQGYDSPVPSNRPAAGLGALDSDGVERWVTGRGEEGFLLGVDRYATSFVGRLSYDYGSQIRFPFAYAKRNPTGFLLGATGIAALVFTDHVTYGILAPRESLEENGLAASAARVSKWGGRSSALPLVLGIGALGMALDSPRERETSLMLVEALLTSATWTDLLKQVSGRERPREREESVGDWEGPDLFNRDLDGGVGLRSFPSGHSTGAWAAATILAHQYPTHGIVPVLAFGAATAASYSRMAVGAHWLSDVVVGGLIGYGCAKQVLSAHGSGRARRHEAGLRLGVDVSGGYKGVNVGYDF